MSSIAYNKLWENAQGDLRKLIREEVPKPVLPPTEEGDAAVIPEQAEPELLTDRGEVIDVLRHRFIRYLTSVSKLSQCYDQIVQPQKRLLLRRLLDTTMGRLMEIKRELVEMDCSEYHYFDDLLVDMKMTPDDINIPIPPYFLQREALVKRMEMLKAMMQKFNIKSQHDLLATTNFEKPISMSEAIQIIQTHERARQGNLRSKFMDHIRKDEERKTQVRSGRIDFKTAVGIIEHWYKQILISRRTKVERVEELSFIGMRDSDHIGIERLPTLIKPLKNDLLENNEKIKDVRRQKRQLHEQGYQQALVTIKETVRRVDGPDMKEQMQDQIRQWYIECRDKLGKFPEYPSVEDGGSLKIFVEKTPEELQAEIENGDQEKKGKKGKGKKEKKEDKKGKGKKGKGKKGAEEDDTPGWKPKPSNFLNELDGGIQEYEQEWRARDESNNFQQTHDDTIIRAQKTRDVEFEIRVQVDEIMREELEQLRAVLDKGGKKGKKGKKGKGKKGKKGKGKKGKKEKDLTPDRTI